MINEPALTVVNQTDSYSQLILGVMLMGHDASYTVLNGSGVPLLIAEEERYSRRKKGTFVPSPRQIEQVLKEVGSGLCHVKNLAITNIPDLIERRGMASRVGSPLFGQSRCTQALLRTLTCRMLNLDSLVWVRHHLCHAASAYLPSPFSRAAVVTVDGMGEDETATIWRACGSHLAKLISISHPHSLGYLYQAIAQWAGMTGAEREGKLMGLAPLGEPSMITLLRRHFLQSRPDGTFEVGPALAALRCDNSTWVNYCESHLGPRRQPDEPITEHHRNVAASMQVLLEEVLLNLFRLASQLTGETQCCAAGGVFMNSMSNGRLRREGPFEDVWVQPMASDNGLSLGAALWAFATQYPERERWRMTTAFLGSEVTDAEILELLQREGIEARRSNRLPHEVAEFLASGKLVGWVRGRSEVGARALGHRSILADPRDPGTKDHLNAKIKQREPWRPFAPMVLEEEVPRLFTDTRLSPFMMFVSSARGDAPIPASLHTDHTGRLQTVSERDEPTLFKLLQAFKERTGIGALLNTSFNVRGEPIVRTAEEAYRIFVGSGMDVLVLNDFVIEKPGSIAWRGKPVAAAQPRVNVLPGITKYAISAGGATIITLGSEDLFSVVMSELSNNSVIPQVYRPSEPEGYYPFVLEELIDEENRRISIMDLPHADLFIVLLPVWTEVAVETIPNLLEPFVALARSRDSSTMLFLDEAGGKLGIEDLLGIWNMRGPRGIVSEIEHFWITRRKQQ